MRRPVLFVWPTVQLRIGRSKWPRQNRPATSLAPVENTTFPAKARSSVPFSAALSHIASDSQRADVFMPQPMWLIAYASGSSKAARYDRMSSPSLPPPEMSTT